MSALLIGAALASGVAWWLVRGERGAPLSSPIRFTVTAETGGEIWRVLTDRPFVLSPDGRAVVYRGRPGNQPHSYIRRLDTLEPRILLDGALMRSPFFSPDGESVAFFTEKEIAESARVRLRPTETICRIDSRIGITGAASWGDDDSIVFAFRRWPTSNKPFPGLMVVPASRPASRRR